MFAIQFIHSGGGVSSISGATLELVRAKAQAKASFFARSCVVSTVPFACRPAVDGAGWDATLPMEVREELGELMRLYSMID
jgi:hypothetical protein